MSCLADGTLICTGRNTFKGVAGYDLTSLLVGSEGTLGIVVSVTVRLRYLSEKTCSIAAVFTDVAQAAAGVVAIARVRVQPAILELLDIGTHARAGCRLRFGPERPGQVPCCWSAPTATVPRSRQASCAPRLEGLGAQVSDRRRRGSRSS